MRFRRAVPLALVLTLTAACGDDGAPADQVELSQAEIQELFLAISSVFSEVADFSVANPGLSLSLASVLQDINETIQCADGGNASVTGTDNSGTNTIDFDADIDFNDCQSQGFTLGGGLNFDGSGTGSDTGFTLEMSIGGDLAVALEDGRNGGCSWDVSWDIDAEGTAVAFTVAGSICGEDFSYNGET
jgi:hypothetical protein